MENKKKFSLKKDKISVDMFPEYDFRVYVTNDLGKAFNDEYDVEVTTRTAVCVTEKGGNTIIIAFDEESLLDRGTELVVHESSHLTTDFMEATGINDDEFRSYFQSFVYKKTLQLLDKMKVPYKVV